MWRKRQNVLFNSQIMCSFEMLLTEAVKSLGNLNILKSFLKINFNCTPPNPIKKFKSVSTIQKQFKFNVYWLSHRLWNLLIIRVAPKIDTQNRKHFAGYCILLPRYSAFRRLCAFLLFLGPWNLIVDKLSCFKFLHFLCKRFIVQLVRCSSLFYCSECWQKLTLKLDKICNVLMNELI